MLAAVRPRYAIAYPISSLKNGTVVRWSGGKSGQTDIPQMAVSFRLILARFGLPDKPEAPIWASALAYVSTVEDPAGFVRSRSIGAHLGLTPRQYQSGEVDRSG